MKVIDSSPWKEYKPDPTRMFRVITVDACPKCGHRNATATHIVRDEDAICNVCFSAFWVPAPGLNWQDKHRR